ncbi:MAG: transcriptional regulator BetI [Paracoccaceae bacterium]
MPKIGMEKIRREALIGAALQAIHAKGSLDVTVGQIATRAGVSTALAHHYFGGKEDLILAAMRFHLTQLGLAVRSATATAQSPRARISAIISANFDENQFSAETISCWLNFYVKAQGSAPAARLLRIYVQRLRSNLIASLRPLVGARAANIAAAIGAMIDGVYLRQGLSGQAPDRVAAVRMVENFVEMSLRGAQ